MVTSNDTLPAFHVKPVGTRFHDLEGQAFGRLTVIGYGGRREPNTTLWWCRCQCGTIKTVSRGDLRKRTLSCGCLAREGAARVNSTHGASSTPEYHIWKDIRQRCFNRRSRWYHRYGGRGISVCPQWADFACFLHDMGPQPAPSHSVERLDNDGPYSPDNCEWATQKQQTRNFSRNRLITWNNEACPLVVWAERTGQPQDRLRGRLNRGWSVERALTVQSNAPPGRAAKLSAAMRRQRSYAHYAVQRAIKAGWLVRPAVCSGCGHAGRIEGHHYLGYNVKHWLDVEWLCTHCHTRHE